MEIISIDDRDCTEDYPCRHVVVTETDGIRNTTKMKADEIFYLCCKAKYPVPEHINEGFTRWIAERQTVHIRLLQFRGRKKTTVCQGLLPETNLNRVLRSMQKNFNVGGAIIDHKDYGRIVTLQGDHVENMKKLLIASGLCSEENIHIHGNTS